MQHAIMEISRTDEIPYVFKIIKLSFVFSIFLLFLPYFFIRCISLLSDSSDSMSSEELFTVEKIRGRRRTPSG